MAANKKTADSAPLKAKFFHDLAPIRVHLHMKAPHLDGADERMVTMLFRMTLNGNLIRSAPDFVQEAYDNISGHMADYVGIPAAIESVTVDIFETDKQKNSSLTLADITITNLEVKEIKSSKSDPSVVLTFQIDYPAEADVWRFLRTHYGMDAFLVFDSAQAHLLALEDLATAKDPKQPDLPIPPSGKDAAAGDAE
jgi:hypothetical protein